MDFISLSEKEKLALIQKLQREDEQERIIELLTDLGTENLSSKLLSELAMAYNILSEQEEAFKILEKIPEADRDGMWFYRKGFFFIAEAYDSDEGSEEAVFQALYNFERALEYSEEASFVAGVMELVSKVFPFELIEENRESLPLLNKHFSKKEKGTEPVQQPKKYKEKISIFKGIIEKGTESINLKERAEKIKEIDGVSNVEIIGDNDSAFITVNIKYNFYEYKIGAAIFGINTKDILTSIGDGLSEEAVNKISVAEKCVNVFMEINDRPLESIDIQLKVLYKILPEMVAVYAESQNRVIDKNWVKMRAESNVISMPTDLFNIEVTYRNNGKVWLHTCGLMPLGLPELEIMDLEMDHVFSMFPLINTFAIRLIEGFYGDKEDADESNDYFLGEFDNGNPLFATKIPWTEGIKYYEGVDCPGQVEDRVEEHNSDTHLIFLYKNQDEFEEGLASKPSDMVNEIEDQVFFYTGELTSKIMSQLAQENAYYLREAVELSKKNPEMQIFILANMDVDVIVNGEKSTEGIWFSITDIQGDTVTGRMTDEAEGTICEFHQGDRATLDISKLLDWQVVIENKIITPNTVYLADEK